MQETRIRSLGWEDPLEREWLPTPVFLLGESHGQRSLAGCSPWGLKESDTTEETQHTQPTKAAPLSQEITVTLDSQSISADTMPWDEIHASQHQVK